MSMADGSGEERALKTRIAVFAAVLAALALPSAGSTAPPTVSLTSPAAGSLLRGTVTVSADASADTASVEFKYFSDASPLGASIGTDTTAPYSVQFDTTAYPKTH